MLSPDRLLAEILGETGYESVLAGSADPYRVQGSLDDLESLQWLAFQCREEGLGEFLRRLAGQDRQANQREEGTEPEDGGSRAHHDGARCQGAGVPRSVRAVS